MSAPQLTSEAGIYKKNLAISALERKSAWIQALGLLAELGGREARANIYSFCPAISACAKGTRWGHSLALLRQLLEETLQTNVAALLNLKAHCQCAQIRSQGC